ncbi:hypothetical protein [Parvimonas micra]
MKNYRVLFPEIKMKYNEKETVVTVVKESNLDKFINLVKLEVVILTKDTSKSAITSLLDALDEITVLVLQEE